MQIQKMKNSLPKQKITILGHDNIDVDAFLSGILLSKLLNFLKIDNEFVILEKVKENETYKIVKELFNIDMKKWEKVSEDGNRNLFLEDHFETTHLGKIVGCIDHHPAAKKIEYKYQYRRNSCASVYLIYEIMQHEGYRLTKEDAKMVIVAMMVDTTSFRNSKTIYEEVEIAKKLAEKYSLEYEKLLKYCLCITPIENMEIKDIVENGKKHYNYAGTKVESAYIQVYGMPDENTINCWLEYLQESIAISNVKLKVFIIYETKTNKTIEYRVSSKKISITAHDGVLSRGKDIMPKIEKMFLK
ncbi:MAG: DHH family phosphoesterase [Clostridia bacterium]